MQIQTEALDADELRSLADDLEGEPLTGEDLRDELISHISDMHKDIYGKRADAHDLRQMTTEELEQEHDKITQTHKDWWYEERHREDQDMWLADEEADVKQLMDPEEGEDMPKQIGMGRGKVREMKITRTRLRQIIKEEIQESYDTNRDGSLSPDELRRIASEIEGEKPLVKRG